MVFISLYFDSNLTKLYSVALSCLTSMSIHDILTQFIEYLKKMPKKNLYSLIETVGFNKKMKSLFDGKVKHLLIRKKINS